MEVVVEKLDIKKKVFDKIEKYRSKGTIISQIHLEYLLNL